MVLENVIVRLQLKFPNIFRVCLKMPKNNVQSYYAVGKGRQTGVFTTWAECNKQVSNIANAKYKKFNTLEEAEAFVNYWRANYSPKKLLTPVKETSSPTPTHISFSEEKVSTTEKNERLRPMIYSCRNQFSLGVKIKEESNSHEEEKVFIPLEAKGGNKPVENIKKLKDSEFYNFKTYYVKRNRPTVELNHLSIQELENIFKSRKNLSPNLIQDDIAKITSEVLNKNNPETLRNALQLFFQLIGLSVNPQMDAQPSTSTGEVNPVNNNKLSLHSLHLKEDNKIDPADIKAVNLRLDSFEKRFDDCLKQVGAMNAELDNLKAQMKSIQEILQDFVAKERNNGPGDTGRSYNHKSVSLQNAFRDAVEPVALSSNLRDSTDGHGSSGSRSSRKLKRKRSPSRRKENESSQSEDSQQPSTSNFAIKKEPKQEKIDLQTFTVGPDEYVHVYTDGACHYNGSVKARAGIGIWFGDKHPMNVSKPLESDAHPTNNNAEIQAATLAIQLAAKAGITKLKIFTDSEFLINCVTMWKEKWKTNGWKTSDGKDVKNRIELEKLDEALKLISVKWEKVLGHSGTLGNEMADQLANQGALLYRKNR